MKRVLPAFVAVLGAVTLTIACKSDPPKPSPATSTAANPYAIDEDDVPTAVDYEDEAAKIDATNIDAELDHLDREINAAVETH